MRYGDEKYSCALAGVSNYAVNIMVSTVLIGKKRIPHLRLFRRHTARYVSCSLSRSWNCSLKHVYVAKLLEMLGHNHDLDGALLLFNAKNQKLISAESGQVQYSLADHVLVHNITASLNVDRTKKGTSGRLTQKDVH